MGNAKFALVGGAVNLAYGGDCSLVGRAVQPGATQLVSSGEIEEAGGLRSDCCGSSGGTIVRRNERGMVSAEWAVGIIAAVALAGVLISVVTNGAVRDALLKVILTAINTFSSGR